MKRVLRTMQIVMVRSTNGSMTTMLTTSLIFSHKGQQSQIKQVLANLYQQGGHFCLDSSSSAKGERALFQTLLVQSEFLYVLVLLISLELDKENCR